MRLEITEPQAELLELDCRYPLMVAGYGAGKTEALCIAALRDAMISPSARVAVYSDTYDQMRLNVMPRMEDKLLDLGLRLVVNRSEYTISVAGGPQFIFRSLDNPKRIIGYEVFRSHVDEIEAGASLEKAEDLWRRIIARNRQRIPGHENRVYCYTTPDQGYGFTYQRWGKTKAEEYKFVRASTRSNPFLPDDYVDALLRDYPGELARAYIEGEWCNLRTGTVYSAFDRRTCATTRVVRRGEPLHVGMDFNVMNMAAVVGVREDDGVSIVDELIGYRDTPAMIEAIRERYPDHVINVYPDAAGGHTSSQDASKSDLILLRQAGFLVRAKKRNPAVRDRVVCVNARFASGQLRVNVDRCPQLTEALEQQPYDKAGEPDKTQDYDHPNDALGYLVHYMMPLKSQATREALWYR